MRAGTLSQYADDLERRGGSLAAADWIACARTRADTLTSIGEEVVGPTPSEPRSAELAPYRGLEGQWAVTTWLDS